MESVSICRDTVATISQRQTLNSCNNVIRTASRRPSSNLLPRGLAGYSSQSSLYVNRSEGLNLARTGGRAYKVKSDGQRGRVVSAKGSDNGSPRPEYRFSLSLFCFSNLSTSFIYQIHSQKFYFLRWRSRNRHAGIFCERS